MSVRDITCGTIYTDSYRQGLHKVFWLITHWWVISLVAAYAMDVEGHLTGPRYITEITQVVQFHTDKDIQVKHHDWLENNILNLFDN